MKNGVKIIQAAAYNGARTVYQLPVACLALNSTTVIMLPKVSSCQKRAVQKDPIWIKNLATVASLPSINKLKVSKITDKGERKPVLNIDCKNQMIWIFPYVVITKLKGLKNVIVVCLIRHVQILAVMRPISHLMTCLGIRQLFRVELIEVQFALILSGLSLLSIFNQECGDC